MMNYVLIDGLVQQIKERSLQIIRSWIAKADRKRALCQAFLYISFGFPPISALLCPNHADRASSGGSATASLVIISRIRSSKDFWAFSADFITTVKVVPFFVTVIVFSLLSMLVLSSVPDGTEPDREKADEVLPL